MYMGNTTVWTDVIQHIELDKSCRYFLSKKLQFVFYSVNLIHIHFPRLSEQGNNIALSLFVLFCDLCPPFG